MKILHITVASAFTEGMSYQDNLLSSQNVADGHSVTVIADCNKFINGKIVYTPPEDSMLSNGVRLIRLEYKKVFNSFITSKIRCVPKLKEMIEILVPDIILFHGVAGWEMFTAAKYKRKHPNVKLYLDSHEDFHNSGTNLISRIFLYKLFNRMIVKKVIPYVDKVFCVTYECFGFLKTMYGISDQMLEYYPLGGVVFNDEIRIENRKRVRNELLLEENDILLIHSGKMDALKRTSEILVALQQIPDKRVKLILIGSMDQPTKSILEPMIQADNRVKFLGWKSAEDLMEYLCACDLYFQPGGQSATLQNALCCGCAVAIYPHESHKYLLGDSAFYINDKEDIKNVLNCVLKDINILKEKQKQSFWIACKQLDYKVLAERLYQ
jgi:glycosyltransferase involved in cell wall biosynthesis